METNIRGIECTLYNSAIKEVLLFLANISCDFYIPWCLQIDRKESLIPLGMQIGHISAQGLKRVANCGIWELVLHMFQTGGLYEKIETYSDFRTSACMCCLIYYDCGLLDLYIKDPGLLEKIYNYLLFLGAEEIALITDSSDGRALLHL